METKYQNPHDMMERGVRHSALPWEIHSNFVGPLVIKSGDTEVAHVGADSFALCQANAAFIVRACNSHQALIAALQNLLNVIETGAITSDHDETFANAVAQARDALKLARGE
jgi:hypothetical protein